MWRRRDTLLFRLGGEWSAARPTAAFDFDSTLHRHRGRGPPEAVVISVLSAFAASWNIAIFTNRAAPRRPTPNATHEMVVQGANLTSLETFLINLRAAGVSCDVFAATQSDVYRKPQIGAWDVYSELRGVVRRSSSFYCGDAAGRPGDFAASDRWFAHNAGLVFFVPEQIFGDLSPLTPPPPLRPGWAAHETLIADAKTAAATWETARTETQCSADVVLMVGSPASGKSTFAGLLAEGPSRFRLVAGDEFSSAAAFGRAVGAAAAARQPVVVDSTAATVATRSQICAQVHRAWPEAKIAAVWVRTPKTMCFHLDGVRVASGAAARLLPRVAIHGYWKRLEPPDASRETALTSVVAVPFARLPGAAGHGPFRKKYGSWAPKMLT